MDRQVFSVILQPMKIDLGLTDAQCGLANTVLIFGMAFFSFPIAYLVDRWSRRKAISLMAILWSVATFATGLARNFTGRPDSPLLCRAWGRQALSPAARP